MFRGLWRWFWWGGGDGPVAEGGGLVCGTVTCTPRVSGTVTCSLRVSGTPTCTVRVSGTVSIREC